MKAETEMNERLAEVVKYLCDERDAEFNSAWRDAMQRGAETVQEAAVLLSRYEEALEGLLGAAEGFSTAAEYTVEDGIEEEFVDALEDARAALQQSEKP